MPELDDGGKAVLRAYDLLDQSRQYTDRGPQAISMGEVYSYLQIARIEGVEDRLLFLSIIKRLDVIYLNHEAEKRRNE